MAIIKLKVLNQAGHTLAASSAGESTTLVYAGHYQPGDWIALESDSRELFCEIQLEDTMPPAMVYLPEGTWYDYWTQEKLTGPVWFVREAPLDVCPIYVKAGSVIPRMEPQSYVGEKPLDTLLLDVYPGEGSHDHYLDNGEDFAYREGKYHQYRFTVKADGSVNGEIVHGGYEKPYERILIKRPGEASAKEELKI